MKKTVIGSLAAAIVALGVASGARANDAVHVGKAQGTAFRRFSLGLAA